MTHYISQNINLASAIKNIIKFVVCSENKGGVTIDSGGMRMIGKTCGEKVTVKNHSGVAIQYHNGKKWTYNPKCEYAISTEI